MNCILRFRNAGLLQITLNEVTGGRVTCSSAEYYNEKLGECCAVCQTGFEKRNLCVKDPSKDCKQPCPKGYYINWEDRPARCCYCANCKQDPDLIEVQPCSTSSNAICHCRPGFYCKTPLENTCARCVSHQKCSPGFRVKKAGNAFNDTVCEECPLGSNSDGSEGCKSHTTRLLKPTMQNFVPNETSKRTPGLYLTAHKPLTTRPQHVTVSHSMATTESDSMSLVPTVTADTGTLFPWYIVGGIICLLILVISLRFAWKQNIWKMKPLISNQKGLQLYKFPSKKNTNLFKYREEHMKDGLLCRENTVPEPDVFVKRETETQSDCERLLRDKPDVHDRDHLTNRIEKIYIMKADTVLVGSISEVPNRQITVSSDSESHSAQITVSSESESHSDQCKENTMFVSHYPQQESGKGPVNDLMLSIEEEGKTKNDSSSLCV
ncbi:tumor necrosis factor receptor superfamily member 8 [Pelobates fuscus]|uniref:tumor necrosis factor receptor superfamily member 8 n=1 Tax=Pelobates fuscus TaxID=191477 RepID=UPI002FE458AD